MPPFLVAQLVLPVHRRRAVREPAAGARRRLLEGRRRRDPRFRPPASTEQVLHPEAYSRSAACAPTARPVAALGAGWQRAVALDDRGVAHRAPARGRRRDRRGRRRRGLGRRPPTRCSAAATSARSRALALGLPARRARVRAALARLGEHGLPDSYADRAATPGAAATASPRCTARTAPRSRSRSPRTRRAARARSRD